MTETPLNLTQMNWLAFFAAIYTLLLVGWGIWQARGHKQSSADYYLAGRGLKAWAAAFSGAASAESGWVLLGLVGSAYTVGVAAFWVIPGAIAGYLFSWLALGPRMRALSLEADAITLPEILALRHPERRRAILLVGSLIILVFMTVYVAAQFNAVGKTLDAIFGLPYLLGVAAGVALIFGYVLFGGFAASVWTDFVQSLLMLAVLVAQPLLIWWLFPAEVSQVFATPPDQSWLSPLSGATGMAALGGLLGWLGIGLGYIGQPHMIVRYMATHNDAELKRAAWIAAAWTSCVLGGAVLLGLVARAVLPVLADPEQAILALAMAWLPLPLTALVLAAILAAICSTADSQLLVVASAVSNDLLQVPKAEGARMSRRILLGVGLVAALMAATKNRVIFDFVLYAFAALGCSFGPALIASWFFKRTSGTGILAAMLGGTLTVIVWARIPALKTLVYEMVPAFIVGLLLAWLVAPHASAQR